MADDARPSTALERPALASALATVTDRPVGHWIAELRSPAFRGGWDIERHGVEIREGSHRDAWVSPEAIDAALHAHVAGWYTPPP